MAKNICQSWESLSPHESIQLIFVCTAETSRLEGNTKGIKFVKDPLTCPLKRSAPLSLKTFELRIAKWSRATENPSQLKERSSAEAEDGGGGGSEDPAFSPPPPPSSHASALPGDFAARRSHRRGEEQQLAAAVGNGGGRAQQQQQQQVFQCSGRKRMGMLVKRKCYYVLISEATAPFKYKAKYDESN